MAGTSGTWIFRLSCGAEQRPESANVSSLREDALDAHASAPQSEGFNHVGAHRATRGGLSSDPANPASLARSTLSRQTPEVEAECLNRACSVLCGGRAAMRVPTAIIQALSRLVAGPN